MRNKMEVQEGRMMDEIKQDDKSLHIESVPGRPLIWKKPPTKRTFTFHLPKLRKTKKNNSNKENLSRSKGNRSKLDMIGTNESSIEHSISLLSSKNTTVERSAFKDQTNAASVGIAAVKHKLVAVKSLANNAPKVPISASKPCEQFETPFLPLMPLATLQRKLVDACGSFDQRKSSEMSRSTSLTNSDSKLRVPSLFIPNKSRTSVRLSNTISHFTSNNTTKCDEKENNSVQKSSHENMSILEYLNSMCSISKSMNTKKRKITGSSPSDSDNSKSTQLTYSSQGSSASSSAQTVIKNSKYKDDDIQTESLHIISPYENIPNCDNHHSVCKSNEISLNINDKSDVATAPLTDALLSISSHNDQSQTEQRNISMQNGNVEHLASVQDDIEIDRETLNANILIISPLKANSKTKRFIFSRSKKDRTKQNSATVDKNQTDESKNHEQLHEPQQEPSLNLLTGGEKRKFGVFEDRSGIFEKSNHEAEHISKKSFECSKKNKYRLPKELVTRIIKRMMKRNSFKYHLTTDAATDISLITKDFKLKQPRKHRVASLPKRTPEFSQQVNEGKALLWDQSSVKRSKSSVTDLEIAMYIFAKNAFSVRDETSNVNTYQKLKTYENAVIKDLTKLISESVELLNKRKEISKLYGMINKKGKKLGELIDERLKLRQQIEASPMQLKK